MGYRIGDGELAGELEFLLAGLKPETGPRIASARLLADVTLIDMPARLFAEACLGSPDLSRRLFRQGMQRLAGIVSAQAARGAAHPEVRFAEGLLAQLDDFGHVSGNKGVFDRRLRQDELAAGLGISRRLLSLRLSDWSARGLVETTPIAITDIGRVELIASFGRERPERSLRAAFVRLD